MKNLRTTMVLLALTASPALAHEIARDGNIGGLMHSEPDDAPVVGKPNAFYFEVNQKGGKAVLLSQCSCTLSVYAGSVRTGAKPLSVPKLTPAKGEYTGKISFPVAGAYTLVLAGAPKAGASFDKFKLTWVVRADGSGQMDMKH